MKNYTLKEYADLLSSVDMLAEAEMMGREETVSDTGNPFHLQRCSL